jgi:hypothetical protein
VFHCKCSVRNRRRYRQLPQSPEIPILSRRATSTSKPRASNATSSTQATSHVESQSHRSTRLPVHAVKKSRRTKEREHNHNHGAPPPTSHHLTATPHARPNAHAWPSERRQRRAGKPAHHARIPVLLPRGSDRRAQDPVAVCVPLVLSVHA